MKVKRTGFCLLLVLSLIWGMVATAAPEAAASTQTEKVTLLTGEKYKITVWIGGAIKSFSSSNKSVIKVKKSGSTAVVCSAKKAGKSTVTIRTANGGKAHYYFTVKKFKVQFRSVSCHYTEGPVNTTSDIAVELVNKSGVYISSAKVNISLYDASGALLEKKDYNFYDLVPGASIYKMITYYGNPVARAEADKKVEFSRTSTKKVANMSNKVNVSADRNGTSMNVKIKNTTKKSVSGSADVVFYNEAGEIVYIRSCSFYLKSKEVSTTPVTLYGEAETASYQIFTRAYAY